MYRALRRRGFSKEAAARISNARTKGHTVKAEPTPGGAIAKPGGRKLTRSEVARLGALARAGKYKGRGRQKGGGTRATPEQRAAEREAKRRQAAQQNRADVLAKMGVDQGDVAAMEALASGTQPENTAALERAGLVERAKDGTARLTAQGRVAYNAASRGDAGAAGDALSRAKDRVTPAAPKGEAAAEKPKGGGGGGKGGKPSEEEKARAKAEQRAKTAQQTAESLGLPDRSADELRRARDEGGVASPALQRLGLIDAEGNTTDQGRRALTALELGKPGDYRAAVQDARNRMTREAAASERRAATEARRGEREAARAARQRRMDRREALRTLGETQKAVDTYDPPESARNNARRGLALRKRWGRGGTAVGVARARDLMNGRSLPYSTVARMASFNRHRQHALDGRKESDGGPSAAYIAWLLWGGTTGVDWARGITGAATKQEAWERAMFANMGSSGGGGGGGKPSGGTGGLWARNPETGKREPSQGLEKGAPPPKPGTARAEAAEGAQRAGAPKGDDSPAATATPTRRFSSPDAADAHLRETMGGIKTTRTEAEALEYYQGGRFQAVNDHLRGVNVLKPGQGKEVVEQQIGGLRSVMNRSATTDNLEVYRGMQVTKSEPRARELLNKWQPGATFREDGFLSTTVDPKIAEGFSGNHTMWSPESGVSAVNVRIRVPAGTPAVYMNAARPRGNTEERELLLRDGLTYRVVSRVERPGGQVDVELEVMP